MKALSMGVSVLAVVSAALASLVSGTKYENHIKLLVVLSLILNILALLHSLDIKDLFPLRAEGYESEYSFDELLIEEAEKAFEAEICEHLREYESCIVSVDPQINIDNEKGIYLKGLRLVLKDSMDSSSIANKLRSVYGCELPLEVVAADE